MRLIPPLCVDPVCLCLCVCACVWGWVGEYESPPSATWQVCVGAGGCLFELGVTFVVAEVEEALTLRAGEAVDVF